MESPLTLLAPAPENSYRDTLFEFGKTYVYVVRSVALAGDGPVEIGRFPRQWFGPTRHLSPAAPQNVVAAVTAPPGEAPSVDLFLGPSIWKTIWRDIASIVVTRRTRAGSF